MTGDSAVPGFVTLLSPPNWHCVTLGSVRM